VSSLWCELAWISGPRAKPGVLLDLDGDRIASLTPGVASPPAGAERLEGLVIPGLANAHSHAFQRALRGRTHAARGSFWTWREQMYALAGTLAPDAVLALARATFAEMALAGVTVVGEFHYLHHGPGGVPYADPNAIGAALLEAAAQAGVRITLIDACYLHGGPGREPDPVQRRFADPSAEAWTERVDALCPGPGARIGAAIHSLRAVDPDSAATVAAWSRGRSAPLHAHVSEQPAENAACLEAYGDTPSGLLEAAGALSQNFTAVHATHLSGRDVGLLGGAGACSCLCPTTERDLADGIGPAQRLLDAGATLALGSDSNAVIEPFEEARAVELDERLATGIRGHHEPAALLAAATGAGYASLGWPEGGALAPGALADLVSVRLDGVRMAGARHGDPVATLVFAGAAADVCDVMVGGRFIVRDGRHGALDVPRELASALAEVWR